MSDNQSWNSSGSEEDMETREEPGHYVGIADLSGVLSKVSRRFVKPCAAARWWSSGVSREKNNTTPLDLSQETLFRASRVFSSVPSGDSSFVYLLFILPKCHTSVNKL